MTGKDLKNRLLYNKQNIGTNLPVAITVPDLSEHPLGILCLSYYRLYQLNRNFK